MRDTRQRRGNGLHSYLDNNLVQLLVREKSILANCVVMIFVAYGL